MMVVAGWYYLKYFIPNQNGRIMNISCWIFIFDVMIDSFSLPILSRDAIQFKLNHPKSQRYIIIAAHEHGNVPPFSVGDHRAMAR